MITAITLLIAHRQEYQPLSEDAALHIMQEVAGVPVMRHQKSSMKLHSF